MYIHLLGIRDTTIDLEDCPNCVGFNIRKAMRAVSQHYDKILAPTGLRGTQFTILTVLCIHNKVTVTDLANYLVMDRTTLTRNLKPLQTEGYLVISPGLQDRRSRQITLSSKGKKTQKLALPFWQKAQREMVDYMGMANTKRFIHDLRVAALSHERE